MNGNLVIVLLIAINLSLGLGTLDPVDFVALQSIRKSLWDLPGSAFFSSWDFTGDPCGFPGVLCSPSGGTGLHHRVVSLSIGDPRAAAAGVAGRLDSAALSRLSALSSLSLAPGRVSGELPSVLPPLLRSLTLARNYFSGSIPSSFSSHRHLRTLDLSHNRLSGPIPASLPALEHLILSRNLLSGDLPRFPSSSPLIRLDLSSNHLSGPVDRSLPRLRRLEYLDLSSNRFSGPIPSWILSSPISILRVGWNAFSGPIRIDEPVSARLIDLSHNRLEGEIPAGLSRVEELYLEGNRFTGAVPVEYYTSAKDGALRVLYLQHNFLTGMARLADSGVPPGSLICLEFNCMVPPPGAMCAARAGRRMTRPHAKCATWGNG